jgi:hypothetical protein
MEVMEMEYNGVKIEQLENGRWRLTDLINNTTRDYRTEAMARKTAQMMSDDQDTVDGKGEN